MNHLPGVPCAGLRGRVRFFSRKISQVLKEELSPGICRHPTGRFCVIMPMRVTIPAGTNTAEPVAYAQAA
jgi:hypothetical protein